MVLKYQINTFSPRGHNLITRAVVLFGFYDVILASKEQARNEL